MRVWRNWHTHQISFTLRHWFYNTAPVGSPNRQSKLNTRVWRNWQTHQISFALRHWIYKTVHCRQFNSTVKIKYAGVVKSADTVVLGATSERNAGSSPVTRTSGEPPRAVSRLSFSGTRIIFRA